MTDKGCPTNKISSFAEQNASLCDPPHPPGDNCWAFPLVPAGSQATKLSTTTLLDGAPPDFWSTARASLPAIAGRQAKKFWPKVDTVLKNPDIYRNLIRNDSKLLLIKKLYFPDSIQGRTQNNYTYQTNGDNKGEVTFYLTFVHKATTSDSMIIALHWEAGAIHPIYIFVSKDKVVASRNLLINEPSLKSYNIPSYYIGKQVYLWITIQTDLIQINFSGSGAISVIHRIIQFNRDANLRRIDVSDSPLTIQRGLIIKNIYNLNRDAYKDVREYEISEGTFVSAV